MKFLTPLIVALALFCTSAVANQLPIERKFRVRIVCADDINCSRAVRLFKIAAIYIKSVVNVNLQVTRVDVTQHVISTGDYYERLEAWGNILKKTHDLTYVVVDAFPKAHYIDFETEGILGIVESIGGLGKRPVIGMSKMTGTDQFTVRIMIHELGHLIGAEHIPFGIMAPSAQQNQYSEAYAIETIQQIEEYLETLPQ